jgi:hypothetical protein
LTIRDRAARLGRMLIRDATLDDWPRIWPFMRQLATAGETFSWGRDITEDDIMYRHL